METMINSTSATNFSLLDYVFQGYWNEKGDPRTANLFLMQSFAPAFTILIVWAVFVLYIGPKWMESRKPFSLKNILIGYNLFMSLANFYFFCQIIRIQNFGLDMFIIKFPSLHQMDDKVRAIIAVNQLYLWSKFVDLLDTIFFVLRKKQNQITGLHVYHHFSVPIMCWSFFRLCANSAYTIPFQLINSFVHVIMYGYYGLAALGPHMQPYLWWKRYITQIQIIQFVALLSYGIYFTLCQQGYDLFYSVHILVQSSLYIYLFGKFYLQTYQNQQKQRTTAKNVLDENNNVATQQNGVTKVKAN